jgi:hypothetical protein
MSDRELKLYVVGESSGDPCLWSEYGTRKIVAASSPLEALEMADSDPRVSVALILPKSAGVLMREGSIY